MITKWQVDPREVQQSLSGMNYPARRDDLIRHAAKNGASEKVISFLENLPDAEFRTFDDVDWIGVTQ